MSPVFFTDMDEKNKKMPIHSKVTGILYDDMETVHIWNIQQSYKFLINGAKLIDLFPGHDKDGNERICFVFTRDDFDLLQPLWMAHRL